jgi:oxygen-independent coproporphyrinogen-3 oxidase
MATTPSDLALYVHIPFCQAKCPYCDFNSYAGLEALMAPYADALIAEMALWREPTRDARVATVFFGGGTPSFLPLAETERIFAALSRSFRLAPAAEITTEANPGSADSSRLAGLRRLGFNRLSLGVQSFHDDELRLLGRIHSTAEARRAYRAARRASFENVNLDLIYGLPGQPLAAWRRTLAEAIALGPNHLSLYALTLEEGTPLAADVVRGRLPAPDPDLAADMYLWASEALAAAGYQHYEISNWALPGRRCRHNLVYWHNQPYLGLGAGAHSCLGGFRLAAVRDPRRYIREVSAATAAGLPFDGFPGVLSLLPHLESVAQVTGARAMAETVILGLRLAEGVSLADFRRRFGVGLLSVYGPAVAELTALGLLERANGRLRLTPQGRLLGNEAFERFLPGGLISSTNDGPNAAVVGRGAAQLGSHA